jgi:hypothetical protein
VAQITIQQTRWTITGPSMAMLEHFGMLIYEIAIADFAFRPIQKY